MTRIACQVQGASFILVPGVIWGASSQGVAQRYPPAGGFLCGFSSRVRCVHWPVPYPEEEPQRRAKCAHLCATRSRSPISDRLLKKGVAAASRRQSGLRALRLWRGKPAATAPPTGGTRRKLPRRAWTYPPIGCGKGCYQQLLVNPWRQGRSYFPQPRFRPITSTGYFNA
jgi:hypothetical protein